MIAVTANDDQSLRGSEDDGRALAEDRKASKAAGRAPKTPGTSLEAVS